MTPVNKPNVLKRSREESDKGLMPIFKRKVAEFSSEDEEKIKAGIPSPKYPRMVNVFAFMAERGGDFSRFFRRNRRSATNQPQLPSTPMVRTSEDIQNWKHKPYPLPSSGYEKSKRFFHLGGTSRNINGEKYQLEMAIGYGSYGVVYKAKKSEGESVALKFSFVDESSVLMKRLQLSPNPYLAVPSKIVMVRDRLETISIMPLLDCDLFQLNVEKNVRFSQKQILQLAGQMASALNHIHSLNYFHADIKPENILLKNVQIRKTSNGKELVNLYALLSDFNISVPQNPNDTPSVRRQIQSPAYSAPEVICATPCTSNADCWSLGLVLAQLIFPGEFEYEDYKGTAKAAEFLLTIHNQIEEIPPEVMINGKKDILQFYQLYLRRNRVNGPKLREKLLQYSQGSSIRQKLSAVIGSCLKTDRVKRITIPKLFEEVGHLAENQEKI